SSDKATPCERSRRAILHTFPRPVTRSECSAARSAREVAGEREGGGGVAGLAAIDLEVFEDPLDIGAGFVERDQLDPVDHADVLAARVAEITQPLAHPSGPGVVGGDRQRVGAAEIL